MILVLAIAFAAVATLVIVPNVMNQQAASAEPTIDEIVAQSYQTEQMTTNLLSNDFVRASFSVHVDSKEALKEIEKRDFQIENIILRTLSGKESADLAGPEGMEGLEKELKSQIDKLMQTGSVVHVYTTAWVIQ